MTAAGDDRADDLRGIQEVALEMGVSQRTLRFYEDKGLIEPQRVGTTRIYTRREVARMQLVLRGKRLGFSIRDIKEFLDLYEADPQHIEQMRLLSTRVAERLAALEKQKSALEQTIGEMRAIAVQTERWLAQAAPAATPRGRRRA